MGDPLFSLFTVLSSVSGESTPLKAAFPVFLASTAPTSPSISPPGSPISPFATALTISPQSTNSNKYIQTKEDLKYNLGSVISSFDSSVTGLGCLMESIFLQGNPSHSYKCDLEIICAGVMHLVHLYRQLKE
ncbi:hypothetical protein O181_004968 [Austropuccinia psidii MF-1]|uniref:Uncharacterized protein n=1 Tax=Austropuccinia psidii MF-1 TaxID=1389203 RepID=A0A9Q3BHN1_9BASI|nr:hypothetical protein [Austropuccinia psidii MF-1]